MLLHLLQPRGQTCDHVRSRMRRCLLVLWKRLAHLLQPRLSSPGQTCDHVRSQMRRCLLVLWKQLAHLRRWHRQTSRHTTTIHLRMAPVVNCEIG